MTIHDEKPCKVGPTFLSMSTSYGISGPLLNTNSGYVQNFLFHFFKGKIILKIKNSRIEILFKSYADKNTSWKAS